ncbi:serine O-acetyltransferase [Marmoricola sp. OAE513]|uniref:serine O-acetyltransferase n=1 Tax=Marmoricola sp. OAE513 TaxID=2817894 RepID=UPI001AE10D94
MPTVTSSEGLSFKQLIFSDLNRYRPGAKTSYLRVLLTGISHPGLLAQWVLRKQQVAFRKGKVRKAFLWRSVGMYLFSADFVPGMDIGPGFMIPHPSATVIGNGLRMGANVTFGGAVTAGVQQPDTPPGEDGFPVVGDGAIVLANAVLVGPVTIGNYAQVGANSVVLSDVADFACVFGVPARKVAERKGILPGSYELLAEPPPKEPKPAAEA